ncbi:hypothetical protein O6H91_18G071600 [Diphasiastrum complanatum]|uniref:Uncharacterized protein n=5 Tax=Diphasiastrum complanatum TaxID=34168 RepID=A0ACC2B2I0_DIPCM|nr:hypothetical protein O6H91_18G071200 [Diphasiastrum complanatum]KAJ7523977.1 hypothetical protein O6H91_18G071200 [Diphasiastrum complanatum]KAJ7523978.1 hypothetical protein O6H91_18G071200 [Diphasiastrum complanatum]KAJ7523979.1 hypothetical protein O6H91_18G071200 [Diphasiastrum complanatum]KAJ7523985.1 hypothetical protein O6H91_18G071600 [Diphasiastrum complanatum]
MFHHHRKEQEEDYSPSGDYVEDDYRNKKSEYGEDYERQGRYESDTPSGYGRNSNQGTYGSSESYTEDYTEERNEERVEKFKKEEAGHKKYEHFAEAEALAAGGYALYERHEVKKDPEHAGRHKLEEEFAGAAAAGGAGFGLYEHHAEKKSEREEEELEGKKKHGWF